MNLRDLLAQGAIYLTSTMRFILAWRTARLTELYGQDLPTKFREPIRMPLKLRDWMMPLATS